MSTWIRDRPQEHLCLYSFLSALRTALLDGVALGAAALFGGLAQGVWPWTLAVGLGVAGFLFGLLVYRLALRRPWRSD